METERKQLAKRIGQIAERIFLIQFKKDCKQTERLDFSIGGHHNDIILMLTDEKHKIVESDGFITGSKNLNIKKDLIAIKKVIKRMETILNTYEKKEK